MKQFTLMAAVGLMILTAASCKKDNYYDDVPQPISVVGFYGASPDAPKLSMYLNANQIPADSLAYKGRIDYVNAYPGNREINAYRNGTKVFTKAITLDEGKFYSAFLTGNYSTAELVVLQDSLINPAQGKATIRFVNMSVGAPALDLVTSNGTSVISNRTYKTNSAFTPVDGDTQYSFVIRAHGSTVDKVIMAPVTLYAGHNYTIWARGIYTATDAAALDAGIARNY
ncbi:DUF4397 domain-containing protein [Mucilaginibacter sp. UYCu711]|uniref:DUF4397 domain-containing protein n=1 Tax=Mucilaginibacter sp. UYCu711 TaxID=3156339 RepID=UPI003D25DC17